MTTQGKPNFQRLVKEGVVPAPRTPSSPPILAVSITKEADELLAAMEAVARTAGRDSRKARLLALTSLALLKKIATVNASVAFLLKGKRWRMTLFGKRKPITKPQDSYELIQGINLQLIRIHNTILDVQVGLLKNDRDQARRDWQKLLTQEDLMLQLTRELESTIWNSDTAL
jgi:hypothetical protein